MEKCNEDTCCENEELKEELRKLKMYISEDLTPTCQRLQKENQEQKEKIEIYEIEKNLYKGASVITDDKKLQESVYKALKKITDLKVKNAGLSTTNIFLVKELNRRTKENKYLKSELFNIARETLLCLEYYNQKGNIKDTLWQSSFTTLYDYLMGVDEISEEEMKQIEQTAKEKLKNEHF